MAEPYPKEGLPLDEARHQVLVAMANWVRPDSALESETLALAQCAGRVTAGPVFANEDIPGYQASVMDGYAIANADLPLQGQSWKLVGRSAPGAPFNATLQAGEAVRILTGAPVPKGAQRVLPQELVQRQNEATIETISLEREVSANCWIRAADEEASRGMRLLEAGKRLGVSDLGRLAACGIAKVVVRCQPRIGLLISGDELVKAGEARLPGQIWESNGSLLSGLLARLGYPLTMQQVVADDPSSLRQVLLSMAANCDVVVSTGGVSAGDSDWIRPLLTELGEVNFWKLFLKPGRPFAFGHLRDQGSDDGRLVPFFGLPGNPVAAAITALQLLWPALQQMEGGTIQSLHRLRVSLANELHRGAGRPELARARLSVAADGTLQAHCDGSQASSRIGSLMEADLLLEIPAEIGSVPAGTLLWAQLLRLPIF